MRFERWITFLLCLVLVACAIVVITILFMEDVNKPAEGEAIAKELPIQHEVPVVLPYIPELLEESQKSDRNFSQGEVSRGTPRTTLPRPNSTTTTRPKVTTTVRPASVADGVWFRLRMCESTNNYRKNTGNGFYGAYQFLPSTWRSLGYSGMPHLAEPAVQDEAAKKLQRRSGWGQWPACSRKLGLR